MTRRRAALAGHEGDVATARALLADPDPDIRATALGALARAGGITAADLEAAAADGDPVVRRRAASRRRLTTRSSPCFRCSPTPTRQWWRWRRGRRASASRPKPVRSPSSRTSPPTHDDALVREAAVAALGAIGDPEGLAAILKATTDKPAVRRRAVLALAPFDGAEVDAALERARTDRDWQVRQAAEDLVE